MTQRELMGVRYVPLTDAEKTARIGLQVQVMDAVISGKGWEALPDELRDQADTPWFKSWLQFDPASALRKIDQPVLVVHGARDTDVPVSEADRIERLAASRPKIGAAATHKAIVAGVDHLLLPATGGAAVAIAVSASRVSRSRSATCAACAADASPRRALSGSRLRRASIWSSSESSRCSAKSAGPFMASAASPRRRRGASST